MDSSDTDRITLGDPELRFLSFLSALVPHLPGPHQVFRRVVLEASKVIPLDAVVMASCGERDVDLLICTIRPVQEGFLTTVCEDTLAALRKAFPDEPGVASTPNVVVVPAEADEVPGVPLERARSAEFHRLKDGCSGITGMFREDAGGYDSKDVFLFEILSRWLGSYQVISRTYRKMEELSVTDSLTGVCNRRKFTDELTRETERVRRYRLDLSLMMIDLDGLKQINDSNGHPAGDAVLRQLARSVLSVTRKVDILARLGGDEFGLILPHTPTAGALAVADRIMARCCAGEARWEDRAVRFSVSAGLATMPPGKDAEQLMARADAALYEAKRRGRGRYVVAD